MSKTKDYLMSIGSDRYQELQEDFNEVGYLDYLDNQSSYLPW